MKAMMPRRLSPAMLCFPGEETHEFWLGEANGTWKRVDHGAGGWMGIETMAFDSAPFWSLSHDDASDDAVTIRWEGLGLQNDADARPWTHWPVAKKEKRTLVATLALMAESGWMEMKRFHAEQFDPSALMLPLPENGMAVWKELGRYVVALTRGEKLLHVALLSSRQLDADAAFEAHDVFAALRAHGFIETLETIKVWASCDTDFVPQLACLFGNASVTKEPRPDPRLPTVASGLLPAPAAKARQEKRRRQHRMMMLATAALVYLCFFGAWWLRLQWREANLNRLDLQLTSAQPEVDLVREAQARWLELEEAINPDLYPTELFHQIVLLLPAEGIRLKEFQIDHDKLIVNGEATTVNDALRFKDRLAANEVLRRYVWNFPVPAIREDNRAEFRAEGTLNGEGAHESQ